METLNGLRRTNCSKGQGMVPRPWGWQEGRRAWEEARPWTEQPWTAGHSQSPGLASYLLVTGRCPDQRSGQLMATATGAYHALALCQVLQLTQALRHPFQIQVQRQPHSRHSAQQAGLRLEPGLSGP